MVSGSVVGGFNKTLLKHVKKCSKVCKSYFPRTKNILSLIVCLHVFLFVSSLLMCVCVHKRVQHLHVNCILVSNYLFLSIANRKENVKTKKTWNCHNKAFGLYYISMVWRRWTEKGFTQWQKWILVLVMLYVMFI